MRLLYFVQYFPPEKASGLPLVMDLLEGFADHGWDVEVYTTTPTRGVSQEVREFYKTRTTEKLFNGKVTVHRMPLYREGTSFAQRTIRYCIFSAQCLVKGLFIPADMIFTGGGPPTQGIVAGLIHKLTKKKVIFNPQDLFPDSMIYAGVMSETSAMVKVWRRIEKFSYKNTDLIITISDDMKQTILNRCDEREKVHVVRNWIDAEKIQPVNREENCLFEEFGLSKKLFYVTYAGNLGLMQGIDTIIDAAEQLREHSDICFILFGNGSEEQRICTRIKERNLGNVLLFPLQSADRVSEVYSLGDLSIVSCKPGTGKVGMPSKTWTIMASGTCIIASFDRGGEMEKILNEAQCGVCVEAGDAEALAREIVCLYKDPSKRNNMSKNARIYAVEAVSKQKAVNAYIDLMEAVKC